MTDSHTPQAAVENDDIMQEMARLAEAATANGLATQANGVSPQLASAAATLALLSALGGNKVAEDSLHFEGTSFILPKNYEGRIDDAIEFLVQYRSQQAAKVDITRVFEYRPLDVAHAVQAALKKVFGHTGKGIAIKTMFGDIEPLFVDVPTGVDQVTQVPWNRVAFPSLNGHIDIKSKDSPQGPVGQITVNAPRAYRSAVDGFFKAVEAELRGGSIYRGKAIVQTEADEIKFMDLSKVKREDVVYGDEVFAHLEANLWVALRNLPAMRAAGQPIKRAVLLEGPYGTGKSLAGYLTAQQAVANGVTFIFAEPGADLHLALNTAQLYAPAVVFFEDIDVLQSNDPEDVSKLLDAFDGVGGKGKEVIAVLTTNNRDKIHKGMLRPGRLDAVIHIADLDLGGMQRLIEASFRGSDVKLLDIDYEAVFEACEGYLPAFVREVATRALRYAMVRVNGMPNELTTDDLLKAAHGLREQYSLMIGAHEIQQTATLEAALHNVIAETLEKAVALDADGDQNYNIRGFEIARK
jgi:transitional endoplasmic reticulum ATPase